MSKMQKNVVNYFPHDANASSSDTLTVLQARFGNDGYAFWFKLLEKLAATDGHCLDCSNPIKWQLFLAKVGVNEITGVEIVNLLVEIKAIDKGLWGSRLIWCQNLIDNIVIVYKNRRRELPLKPLTTGNNAKTTGKNGITTTGEPHSRVEYSKVEYMVIAKYPNIKLTQGEYDKLFAKFDYKGTMDRIENLSLYIGSKGDHYKSHYFTILSWDRRDARDKPKRPRGEDKW